MRKAVETAVSVIFASTGLKAGVNENGLENCHQDSTMLKLQRFFALKVTAAIPVLLRLSVD
jgi:hypothetical protein